MSVRRKRPRQDDGAYDDEAQGRLVADHLRGCAERAEDPVLAPRGPAAEDDAVLTQGRKGKDEEDPYVHIPDYELHCPAEDMDGASERDHGKHGKGGENRYHGPHDKDRLVRLGRHHVLLREGLDAVGYGLKKAEGSHPVGSAPYLDAAEQPPLRKGQVGKEGEEAADHHDALDDRFYQEEEYLHYFTPSSHELLSISRVLPRA